MPVNQWLESRKIKKTVIIALFTAWSFVAAAQSLYERWPIGAELCVHVFGCSSSNGQLKIISAGSGATYVVPSNDKDENFGWMSIVTAKHNLMHDDQKTFVDALLVKMRPATSSSRACFVVVPLQTNVPQNFWTSPRGLDIVLIPLPPELVQTARFPSFKESQILTPAKTKEYGVSAGLLTYSTCHQPGYVDLLDLNLPESAPIIRMGHLSRLGWTTLPNSNVITRCHVVDAHTSPGNSGAIVVINVVTKDKEVRAPFFLGIVRGYLEEEGSYVPYEMPINIPTSELILTSADTSKTNVIAVGLKTKANPDLTDVVPVDELVDLRKQNYFLQVIEQMAKSKSNYTVQYGPEIK